MTERQFQISFERLLNNAIPGYNVSNKLNSDTIFYYLNKTIDEYNKLLYRAFQLNQEISDKMRKLVTSKEYSKEDFSIEDNKWTTNYPEDYLFALGETVSISIINRKCENLAYLTTVPSDVIEATIETIDRILNNSLSEYHLHHGQAKPVRLYTDNSIVLYTDGNYYIKDYKLTYLKPPYHIGDNLSKEYEDFPEVCHQEIVDAAVLMYLQQATSIKPSERSDEQ